MKEIKTCEEIFFFFLGLYYSMLPVNVAIKISKKIAGCRKGKQKTPDTKRAKSPN